MASPVVSFLARARKMAVPALLLPRPGAFKMAINGVADSRISERPANLTPSPNSAKLVKSSHPIVTDVVHLTTWHPIQPVRQIPTGSHFPAATPSLHPPVSPPPPGSPRAEKSPERPCDTPSQDTAPEGTRVSDTPSSPSTSNTLLFLLYNLNQSFEKAKRIGKTRSVVIAFEGPKVPNYVRYGNLLVECSLHRKQIDVCYQCGRVGHRMDVCPNPQNRICRGCGIANPDKEHACVPKCGLCGGKHLTADRACKAKFKTPYVVRRRRWERRRAIDDSSQEDRGPAGRAQRSTSSRSRSRTPARKGSHQSRQRSRSRSRDGPNRADQAPSAGSKDGRRWETMGKGGSRSSSGRRRGSRSRSRTRSRTRVESNQRGILAEKKVGWTNRSSVALGDDKEFPPLNPNAPAPSSQNAATRQECGECTELKRLIERQNAQIQEQNVQIRALMSKIDALASGSSATKLTKTSPAPEDANEKRKVPRRDPLSPRLERRGEAQPMHQALNVQEAMDAETTADCKTAAAAPQPSNQQQQPPQEGKLPGECGRAGPVLVYMDSEDSK
ncbi:serine/arginine repetitive matrix protein 2-like [Dermacentor albipictus]|uniref:serine/arginine repetitive matrix protein 2-like n=1 Tax=Dermacentor albipictus TaxID=60249 RepID=UPI0038FC4EF8